MAPDAPSIESTRKNSIITRWQINETGHTLSSFSAVTEADLFIFLIYVYIRAILSKRSISNRVFCDIFSLCPLYAIGFQINKVWIRMQRSFYLKIFLLVTIYKCLIFKRMDKKSLVWIIYVFMYRSIPASVRCWTRLNKRF